MKANKQTKYSALGLHDFFVVLKRNGSGGIFPVPDLKILFYLLLPKYLWFESRTKIIKKCWSDLYARISDSYMKDIVQRDMPLSVRMTIPAPSVVLIFVLQVLAWQTEKTWQKKNTDSVLGFKTKGKALRKGIKGGPVFFLLCSRERQCTHFSWSVSVIDSMAYIKMCQCSTSLTWMSHFSEEKWMPMSHCPPWMWNQVPNWRSKKTARIWDVWNICTFASRYNTGHMGNLNPSIVAVIRVFQLIFDGTKCLFKQLNSAIM